METDYAIIGGGVVGLAVAWGLLRRGRSVAVLDGGDGGFHASRGNFGLIWVQSKGLKEPRYARWSQRSAAAWAGFADELSENTGIDLALEQHGGYDFHFTEEGLAETVASYEALKRQLGGDYPFEVLGNNALRKEEPATGPGVAGAILHHQDGHANPLRLLMALADDVRRQGGKVMTGKTVDDVAGPGPYTVHCNDGTIVRAGKVVLSAGLGAITLGPRLGFVAPIRAQRGQVLITEKLPKLLNRPSGTIRQVNEGGVQIGATNEEVGLDDNVTLPQIAALAADAVRVFPALARAQLVRSWAALRVLSRDGLPIYQESPLLPGVFLVTCHSGITLAAAHALILPDWLEGSPSAPDLAAFSEARFSAREDSGPRGT
ncbi:MAG: FAD-dependent oxidoreductase [Nitratireductor sp.]